MGLWVQDQWDHKTLPLAIGLALFVTACAPVSAPAQPTLHPRCHPRPMRPRLSANRRSYSQPHATLTPLTRSLPTAYLPLPPSPTPGPRVCSPLEDVTLAEIPRLIAGNTYQTPQPGRDDGHPGIDLAYYSHGSHKTILGLPVHAAVAGRVAAVLPDRKPYGNMVIIEMPLEVHPRGLADGAELAGGTRSHPHPRCAPDLPISARTPAMEYSQTLALPGLWSFEQPLPAPRGRSRAACGQPVGEVGTTGASVNPHLHFEARLGPAGAIFTSFGHYDTRTTNLERNNYCLWRVSSWFELVDPLQILLQQP